MTWLRVTLRLASFALFLAATALLAASLLVTETLTRRTIDRLPWARRCFRWACRCLGLEVRVHGAPVGTGTLYTSNHISWSDIPILGGLTPLRFLSKAEVGSWPVIGWLAHQAGTLFIKRGSGQSQRVRSAIAGRLEAGESVLVFPEGTTGQGLSVLPFHGRLLGAALETGAGIQPISISYRRNGRPDHLAPFVGDDAFDRHIVNMLKHPSPRIDVLFHPAVWARPQMSTAELAMQLQSTVQEGLARIQAGELDDARGAAVRTADGPELSRLR